MNLSKLLRPVPTISEQDIATGLRWLTWEGIVDLGFNSITTSGFLAAFALMLGANNLQIGVLAAMPFLMQIIQIPSIFLVDKVRLRKKIAVLSWLPSQLLWFPIALIPFFIKVPSTAAISFLIWLITARGLLNAVCNAAWNGWVRDLVPQTILGRYFSRRFALATMTAVAFSLGSAYFIDCWQDKASSDTAILGYTYVLLFGALFLGLASPLFMTLMPEPLMQPVPGTQPSLKQRLSAPLRDTNFRRLLQFLFSWAFASNLAIPFFAVYMLKRLAFPLTWVIALSVLSQFFNIFFLRIWGRFVDRFGNKVILSVCTSLYLLVIAGWIFTTMPERYFLTIPLLLLLHIFAGIANAGVTITVATIGLKLAPQSQSTSYLAGASLATNLGSGLGPLCGGLMADFFTERQLDLMFTWIDPVSSFQFPAISIIGFDFLFAMAFILGLLALGVLSRVHEEGEVGRELLLESLFFPTREISRPMSTVPAYNFLANFPFGFLKHVPIPGIDVAFGVTAYQIAEMARSATVAAVSGRRLTKKLVKTLDSELSGLFRNREEVKKHGIEIARQAARGAIHAADDTALTIEKMVLPVASGVVKVASQAGVDPLNGISGVSQGIIQGAVETGADLNIVTTQAIKAARKTATESGLSEEVAVSKATEGALQAAEAIGANTVIQVREAISVEALQEENKKQKQKD